MSIIRTTLAFVPTSKLLVINNMIDLAVTFCWQIAMAHLSLQFFIDLSRTFVVAKFDMEAYLLKFYSQSNHSVKINIRRFSDFTPEACFQESVIDHTLILKYP